MTRNTVGYIREKRLDDFYEEEEFRLNRLGIAKNLFQIIRIIVCLGKRMMNKIEKDVENRD